MAAPMAGVTRSPMAHLPGEFRAPIGSMSSVLRTSKPVLLFRSPARPYPLSSGASCRNYIVLRQLFAGFEVVAMCFNRAAMLRTAEEVVESVEVLSGLARVEAFPIPQEHDVVRLL